MCKWVFWVKYRFHGTFYYFLGIAQKVVKSVFVQGVFFFTGTPLKS